MKKIFSQILLTGVFTLLLMVSCSMTVLAEPDSQNALETASESLQTAAGEQTWTVQKDGVTFKVTYPSDIRCGTPTTFRFETFDSSGKPMADTKYRIHSLMVHDGSEYVNVYDISYGSNSAYSTKQTFDFTFYASGKYYIRFNALYQPSAGQPVYVDTGSFNRGMVLNIHDPAYPSVEAITDEVARECLAQCSTDFEKAVWLNDWIVDNCRYDDSYTYCSAEGVLARGTGTCEAYHRAYVMLLNKVGISTGRVTGNVHVWTAVNLDGKWYQVDTTWNDAGYTDPNLDLKHLYFGLNDTITTMVHSDHKPVKGYESNSLENNYFIKTGEIMKWAKPQIEVARKHIAARDTEFILEIKNTHYVDVLYSLVAHVLTNTSWSDDAWKIELTAEYRPKYNGDGSIDGQNGSIVCSVQYEENIGGNGSGSGNGNEGGSGNGSGNENGGGSESEIAGVTVYNGVDYSSVYNYNYYVNKNPDIKMVYGNDDYAALDHFVNHGMREGRQGCAEFNVQSYQMQYTDLRNAFGSNLRSYYEHYIHYGKREGRKGTGCTSVQGAVTVYNGVDYSSVYDYNYYISKNPDIKSAFGLNDAATLQHFVAYGMNEGRKGCEGFNVQSYRMQYVDLRNAFGSNLRLYYEHYVRYGKREGRKGTGCTSVQGAATVYNGVDYRLVYDYNYYISKNHDIKMAYGNDDQAALAHFVNYGMREGRLANANFNVHIYRSNYQDLKNAFGDNLQSYFQHYMTWGIKEGRTAK